MKITETELQALKNAGSEAAWNLVCDQIKSARDGSYPPDWYPKVIASGLMYQVTSKWGE